MPSSATRSGGSAGRSRIRRTAVNPRPRVLNNHTLAILDAGLHQVNESTDGQAPLFLGCPFYKNDPRRHQACMTFHLTTINYMKQHLHRCHTLPHYCPTCYDTFMDTTARDQHIVNRVCNGPLPGVLRPVGVDSVQRAALGRRVGRTLSLENQWLEVYRILFGQDAERPASIFIGNPVEEVSTTIKDIWKNNASAIIAEALATSGDTAVLTLMAADAIVERLLERTLALASQPPQQPSSQPSSQETVAATTFSRSTTALNSQIAGDAPIIKAEPNQADHAHPVHHLDPNLFTPAHNNNLANDSTMEVDDTDFGMAAVAAYNMETATPTNHARAAAPNAYTTYTADPMPIDSTISAAIDGWCPPLVTSPSPEPDQAGPSKWPRLKRKTPTSISASSRSGSLQSMDSPPYGCAWSMLP